MRNQNIIAALILGGAILASTAVMIVGVGRYSMSSRPSGTSGVFVLDRFTGTVRRCSIDCEVLKDQAQQEQAANRGFWPTNMPAYRPPQ